MILVDSSVWIDYFRGTTSPQTARLDTLLGSQPVAIGDLILTEVLQGFTAGRDFNRAKRLLTSRRWGSHAGEHVRIIVTTMRRFLKWVRYPPVVLRASGG